MKTLVLIACISIFFVSCAKTDEQLVESAKNVAKQALTDGNCSKAIDALKAVGNQPEDAIYISLLASAYACEGDYSELDLITDVGSINTSADQVLGSLASLPSSNETSADSDEYQSIMSGIDVILESADGAAARASKFGSLDGANLNFQALWMILVELGKFSAYYGNTDSSGAKGTGGAGNNCFFTYTVGDATTYIGTGAGGACVTGETGHADLPGPANSGTTLARLCDGIYLLNNMRDILANVDVGDSATFASLADISPNVEAALDLAYSTPTGGTEIDTVRNVYTKEECASLSVTEIEKWYAHVFETALQ